MPGVGNAKVVDANSVITLATTGAVAAQFASTAAGRETAVATAAKAIVAALIGIAAATQ